MELSDPKLQPGDVVCVRLPGGQTYQGIATNETRDGTVDLVIDPSK